MFKMFQSKFGWGFLLWLIMTSYPPAQVWAESDKVRRNYARSFLC